MKAHIEEMYGKKRKEHNIEKYILWVSTLLLTIWVYLHSFSCLCLQNLWNPAEFFENSNLQQLTTLQQFKVIQGNRSWSQSKAHMQLPISHE